MTKRSAAAGKQGKLAVLYIDYEPDLLETVKSYLERKGFSVETCRRTADAIGFLEDRKFDAIISEHRKPECDAISFLHSLRENGNSIPFIIFTGDNDADAAIEALNSGADFYLKKGEDPKSRFEELSGRIRQAVTDIKKEMMIQSFFYTHSDLMFVKDEKLRYILANDATLNYFGLKREDLIYKTDSELMDAKAAKECLASDKKALLTGKPVISEETAKGRTFETVKFPLEIAPGKTGVGGIIRDVTDRKQAEAGLRTIEDLNRHIIGAIPDILIRCDRDGTLIDIQIPDESRFVMHKQEIIGKTLTEVIPGDLGILLVNTVRSALDKKKIEKVEYPLSLPEGAFYYEARVIPYLEDEAITLLRDITDRKEAEEGLKRRNEELAAAEEELRQQLDELVQVQGELRENEAYIRTVLDNIPVGIAVNSVKPEVNFDYFNQNFLKYYRVTEEALGKPGGFWTHAYEDPDFREEIRERVLKDIEDGDPEKMHWEEIPITREGEETTFINARNIPLPHRGLVISMVWDVTEQKKAEDRIGLHLSRVKSLLDLYRIAGRSKDVIMSHALESSKSMTESRYAFIGLISPEESEMVVHKWSEGVMQECNVHDNPLHFPISSAGAWAECIRRRAPVVINDYSSSQPEKHDIPKGHVEINRFISIPIFDGKKIAAILVVANKEADYQNDDTDSLTTLGNLMWEIIKNKEAEEELKREKELFKRTFESLQDAGLVLDADPTHIRAVNEAAVSLFGYSREEMIEQTTDILYVDRLSHESFREHVYLYLTKHKKIPMVEFRMKRSDGTIFSTENSIAPLYDSGGNLTGWVSIIRDITERKEFEIREKASLKQIEENMEQLATLNDQIRNPLTVITGLVELKCPESAEEIINQVTIIDGIIKLLDAGWVRSEKIWEFLRSHYRIGEEDADSDIENEGK